MYLSFCFVSLRDRYNYLRLLIDFSSGERGQVVTPGDQHTKTEKELKESDRLSRTFGKYRGCSTLLPVDVEAGDFR